VAAISNNFTAYSFLSATSVSLSASIFAST
jgi:hypothetical protein